MFEQSSASVVLLADCKPGEKKNMNHLKLYTFISVITIFISFLTFKAIAAGEARTPVPAPEFTHSDQEDWINSEPLKLKELNGKVVLIDFWTFDCWNCYRSFPWLNAMEQRLPENDFLIIGVHSPEFSHEKIKKNIVEKIKEFDLKHPIMIDNDFSYWKAMYNKYWPAFYLVDKKGLVRGIYYGETHEDDPQAKHIEKSINALLAE